MNKDLLVYDITVDPLYAKEGKDLAIEQIAFVTSPAVLTKGFAFESNDVRKLVFRDDTKMRIAAPALIPMSIYRNDEFGEYYVRFSEEVIEDLHYKLMKNLTNKGVFNTEHNPQNEAPAFILEAWLVGKNPQADRSWSEFNIDVPTGTLFIVAQVTDKDYYDTLVKEDRTGFSIEGFLGLKLSEIINSQKTEFNIKSQHMKKANKRFKATRKFAEEAEIAESGELTVVAEAIAVDEPIVVIDENLEIVEDFSGELVVEDTTIVVDNGTISEVSIPTETPEEEIQMEEVKEEEVKEEVKEEEVKMQIDETELMNILAPKFDEIYSMIADLKVLIESGKEEKPVDEIPVEMNVHQKLNAVLKFAGDSE